MDLLIAGKLPGYPIDPEQEQATAADAAAAATAGAQPFNFPQAMAPLKARLAAAQQRLRQLQAMRTSSGPSAPTTGPSILPGSAAPAAAAAAAAATEPVPLEDLPPALAAAAIAAASGHRDPAGPLRPGEQETAEAAARRIAIFDKAVQASLMQARLQDLGLWDSYRSLYGSDEEEDGSGDEGGAGLEGQVTGAGASAAGAGAGASVQQGAGAAEEEAASGAAADAAAGSESAEASRPAKKARLAQPDVAAGAGQAGAGTGFAAATASAAVAGRQSTGPGGPAAGAAGGQAFRPLMRRVQVSDAEAEAVMAAVRAGQADGQGSMVIG
jgi:hypothetical protein